MPTTDSTFDARQTRSQKHRTSARKTIRLLKLRMYRKHEMRTNFLTNTNQRKIQYITHLKCIESFVSKCEFFVFFFLVFFHSIQFAWGMNASSKRRKELLVTTSRVIGVTWSTCMCYIGNFRLCYTTSWSSCALYNVPYTQGIIAFQRTIIFIENGVWCVFFLVGVQCWFFHCYLQVVRANIEF